MSFSLLKLLGFRPCIPRSFSTFQLTSIYFLVEKCQRKKEKLHQQRLTNVVDRPKSQSKKRQPKQLQKSRSQKKLAVKVENLYYLKTFFVLESSDNNTTESLPAQNGSSVDLGNNSENAVKTNWTYNWHFFKFQGIAKNESEMIAELQNELRKAEQSKRVLYNALVRERSLNNDKPSVASTASKTGHNFCKPYSALSGDQKKDRIRLLASVVAEFADPKNSSPNKSMEVGWF